MVEIPDNLRCLFNGHIERQGDSYRIEVPRHEVEQDSLTPGETYRVAVLPQSSVDESDEDSNSNSKAPNNQVPPVDEGDLLTVEIETLGDQGDGIAKIDRGYVVIVPGVRPGDEVTVEIQEIRDDYAFAEIRQGTSSP